MKRLAMADKTFQIAEQSYLENAVRNLGLDPNIIYEIDLDDFEMEQLPSSEQDRMTILYYLLFLSTTDHILLNEEIATLRQIGFELGFREDQVLKMIEIVQKSKGQPLDPEQLIDVIRSVLN